MTETQRHTRRKNTDARAHTHRRTRNTRTALQRTRTQDAARRRQCCRRVCERAYVRACANVCACVCVCVYAYMACLRQYVCVLDLKHSNCTPPICPARTADSPCLHCRILGSTNPKAINNKAIARHLMSFLCLSVSHTHTLHRRNGFSIERWLRDFCIETIAECDAPYAARRTPRVNWIHTVIFQVVNEHASHS